MPVNITIRSVPDAVRDRLAERASAAGQSMQEYLSARLAEMAARPTLPDALAIIRANAAGYPLMDPQWVLDALDEHRR